MARTIYGNLIGKAAHKHYDDKGTDWTQFPNSNYWKSGAMWAKDQIESTIEFWNEKDYDRAIKAMSAFWNRKNNWMTICLKAEKTLSLIKALCNA